MNVLSDMERINRSGLEEWQRQVWFYDIDSGTGTQGKWAYSTGMLTSYDVNTGSPLMTANSPSIDMIDLANFDFGTLLYNVVPPGHYLIGIYYRWWYKDSVTGGWLYQDSPFVQPPRIFYQNGTYYFTGYYQNRDTPVVTDTDRCDTAGNFISIPHCGQVGWPPCSSAASARSSVSHRLRQLTKLNRSYAATPTSPTAASVDETTPTCFGRAPTIVTTAGHDTVGTRRSDVIVGTDSDDVIYGGAGADLICGGDGADVLLGGVGADRVTGDIGNDALLGGEGADLLIGGDDTDIVVGDAGGDRLHGGGQSLDILAYLFSRRGVQVDFGRGRAFGQGGDRFKGFNAVAGSSHDDTLLGTSGTQWFVPLGGNDRVVGGDSTDVIVYLLADHGINVDLASGQAFGEGLDGLEGVEVVFGSPFDDTLVGDVGYNVIYGDKGDDLLDGTAGGDTLDAGLEGADVCVNGDVYLDCENQAANLVIVSTPAPTDSELPA